MASSVTAIVAAAAVISVPAVVSARAVPVTVPAVVPTVSAVDEYLAGIAVAESARVMPIMTAR